MGQQVPFETVQGVAEAIANVCPTPHTRPTVRLMPDGDRYLPRVEMRIGDRPVHLYEAYWAPVTEGRVSIGDVLSFLREGAWRALGCIRRQSFSRALFGEKIEMEVAWGSFALLAAALTVLIGLLAHYAATAILLLALAAEQVLNVRLPHAVVARCLRSWGIVAAPVTCVVGLIWVGTRAATAVCRRQRHGAGRQRVVLSALLLVLAFAVCISALSALHLLSVPFLGSGSLQTYGDRLAGWAAGHGFAWGGYMASVVICAWAWALWFLKKLIVQYMGDVAAYVSAHKASKFKEVRDGIQEVGLRVARYVYGQKYDRVVFVGHSLGSVVAYDTLNAMIRWDEANGMNAGVVARTSRLITFGSPLDKTAFIFSRQVRGAALDIREGLALAVQPLIRERTYRRHMRWLNIYSQADIISGPLDYYGVVHNIADPYSRVPLYAHVQYWKSPWLGRVLLRSVQ
jgi:hypothetical protein